MQNRQLVILTEPNEFVIEQGKGELRVHEAMQ